MSFTPKDTAKTRQKVEPAKRFDGDRQRESCEVATHDLIPQLEERA